MMKRHPRNAKSKANHLIKSVSIKRHLRNAKSNARHLVKTVASKSGEACDGQRAVVTLDPFMVNKDGKTFDYISPICKEDACLDKGKYTCQWQICIGLQGTCGEVSVSFDDLNKHVMEEHANGTKGLTCNWVGCSKRRSTIFNSKTQLEEHLKLHIVITSEPDSDKDIPGNLSDESCNEQNDSEDTDSTETDEDLSLALNKRKKKHGRYQRKLKKVRSEAPVPQSAKTVKQPTKKIVVPCKSLTYSRFMCLWEFPDMHIVNNRTNPKLQNVTCLRKFTVLEESINHLHGHHLAKARSKKGPYKCCWNQCGSKDKDFKTIRELEEHVIVHTEEKMITFSNNLPEGFTRPVQKVIHTIDKLKPSSHVATVEKSVPAEKSAPTEKPAPVEKSAPVVNFNASAKSKITSSEKCIRVGDSIECVEEVAQNKGTNSWMVAALRALLSCKLHDYVGDLCPSMQLCLHCRFISLRNRLTNKDASMPYLMYEFTHLGEKFKTCENNPMKFLCKFLFETASHETVYHDSTIFEENFWTTSMDNLKFCSKHPLNQNLANLFNADYKNCLQCTKHAAASPTFTQHNLIIHLGANKGILYPDLLLVKGEWYELCAVVCHRDDANDFYSHVKLGNSWITYYDESSNVARTFQVFQDEGACIVVYVAKDFGPFRSISVGKSYSFDECRTIVDQQAGIPFVETDQPRQPLKSLFASRQSVKDGDQSCINSVLLVLLTTSLPTVVKTLCPSGHRCCFCRMLSFTQSLIHSPKGTPTEPFELSLYKEEFGITSAEGDPELYISNLISEIIVDEKDQHNSNDAKYLFMIRFQKKSCMCSINYEAFHWTLSPTRKNESLLDMMANCSMHCAQCNVMTAVQPIQMPDNLIITIKRSGDASVHYPDEWTPYSTRCYFLSAIVVDDPTFDGGCKHYFAYCYVFGKWMKYDDGKAVKAPSCDVLGNKRACVLVYVSNELTPQAVQNALGRARSFSEVRNLPDT